MLLPTCPICGSSDVATGAEGEAICQDCGTGFILPPISCPSCEHPNVPGAEACEFCGEPLSLVARVVERQLAQPSLRRLDQVRAQAPALKAEGEKASEARMATYRRAEQLRVQELRRMSAARAEEDRGLLLAAAAVVAFVLVALAVVALVLAF